MKIQKLLTLALTLIACVALHAQDATEKPKPRNDIFRSVSMDALGEIKIVEGPLTLNNFNLLNEEAFLGGYKITAQVTGRNRSQNEINYTIYIIAQAYDEEKKTARSLACFKLEPEMNIHEAGKIETITDSGLLSESDFKAINRVMIKLVMQKGE